MIRRAVFGRTALIVVCVVVGAVTLAFFLRPGPPEQSVEYFLRDLDGGNVRIVDVGGGRTDVTTVDGSRYTVRTGRLDVAAEVQDMTARDGRSIEVRTVDRNAESVWALVFSCLPIAALLIAFAVLVVYRSRQGAGGGARGSSGP
jgi:ATP-dependent Zn protease